MCVSTVSLADLNRSLEGMTASDAQLGAWFGERIEDADAVRPRVFSHLGRLHDEAKKRLRRFIPYD